MRRSIPKIIVTHTGYVNKRVVVGVQFHMVVPPTLSSVGAVYSRRLRSSRAVKGTLANRDGFVFNPFASQHTRWINPRVNIGDNDSLIKNELTKFLQQWQSTFIRYRGEPYPRRARVKTKCATAGISLHNYEHSRKTGAVSINKEFKKNIMRQCIYLKSVNIWLKSCCFQCTYDFEHL